MSKRKTKTAAATSAASPSPPVAGQTADPLALQAAMWAFIAKAAAQHGERDDMLDGQHSAVRFAVTAEMDGQRFQAAYAGTVDVGHKSSRASSVVPDNDILDYVLAKLNAATRDAVCRDLIAEYAATGGKLPPVAAEISGQAEKLRASLRQAGPSQAVRGSVRCVVQPAAAELLNVVRPDEPTENKASDPTAKPTTAELSRRVAVGW